MKMFNKIKSIIFFWKKGEEEIEMPYERALIVYNEDALGNGLHDDLNKKIVLLQGDDIIKEEPYSKSRIKIMQEVEHIPIWDSTKDEKFIEGEEINPMEVRYEK
jgi:hypothetical protein